jgi:glutathione peroxidase-family protein
MSSNSLDIESDMSNVTLFSKVDVNGPQASPVFQFLRYNSDLFKEGKGEIAPIKWNFGKFLVDQNGGVVANYSSGADNKIKEDIQHLLEGTSRRKSIARAPTKTLETDTK